ncbi:MAG: hypothetical protein FJY10_07965 [Bacteroidetes bacterium]|nr:hypothetical protein [Bacteroidota bacterium]
MKKILFLMMSIPIMMLLTQCGDKYKSTGDEDIPSTGFINDQTMVKVVNNLIDKYGKEEKLRIKKGVQQAGALWRMKDGNAEAFETYCMDHFIGDQKEREQVFMKLSNNLETLFGHFNVISLNLKKGLHEDVGEIHLVDEYFGAYEAGAHLNDDFFTNKLAFYIILNFPFYSLEEKNEMGASWSRLDWAYARMGDLFTSRVPASVLQKAGSTLTAADNYISAYNIMMGNLLGKEGKKMFPADMKLITHWGLRDELKANYAQGEEGLIKQKMIYEVMKHIINQTIPDSVINNPRVEWDPYTNKVFAGGKEMEAKAEPNKRYQVLLDNFLVMKEVDKYSPNFPTYIKRKFESEMEIPQEQVEKLFTDLVSSPQVKAVAELIKKRLGRNLEPFDIWYDGFKPRSGIKEEDLTAIVRNKYPDTKAFERDMSTMLVKLGFKPDKAMEIASRIVVDAARGSGHAWGAAMKGDKAHLRTRIPPTGMEYKGYNIAVHEFGHNVEQTLTLYDMDYYLMNGVPNTAFTEATAFLFQRKDLELLGKTDPNPDKENLMALDNFWSCYEIMGVSLVDMNVWKWMYEHPEANAQELKENVIRIAKEIWNLYYAPVFGSKDEPILAIYSHMIDNPLYLSAYPIGHLIEFQIEKQIKGKSFAEEIIRMYTQGRLTPGLWMKGAVGQDLSIKPMLEATDHAANSNQ